jgi:hypothetical protein
VVAPSTITPVASGSGACRPLRFHEAEEIKGQTRGFVYRLLHNPDTQLRQILDQREQNRAALGRVEKEVQVLLNQLIAEVDTARDGYVRPAAKRRISEEELRRYLAEIEQRKGRPGRHSKGCATSERGSQSSTSSPPW